MVTICAVVGLAITCLILVVSANRGLGLMDEAYYIAWIRQPEQFAFNIHPFGFYYRPFFDLLGRSILAIRLFGMALLLGGGAAVGYFSERYYRARLGHGFGDGASLVPLAALFSLAYYALWILTPSYNLLGNVTAALIMAGCLGWVTPCSSRRANRLAAFLIGLGGCQAFFGKPTFGLLAAGAVLIVLARGARASGVRVAVEPVLIAGTTSVALLLLHIGYVTTPSSFVATITAGTRVLNFGNSLTALPRKVAEEIYHLPPIFFVTVSAVTYAYVSALDGPRSERTRRLLSKLAIGVVGLNLLLLMRATLSALRAGSSPWQTFGILITSLLLAQVTHGLSLGPLSLARLRAMHPVFILAPLPSAIAFGTVNNTLAQTSISLFGPLLGSVLAASRSARVQVRACMKIATNVNLLAERGGANGRTDRNHRSGHRRLLQHHRCTRSSAGPRVV